MLSVVEVAKTPSQIFDRFSSFVTEMFPSTTSTPFDFDSFRLRSRLVAQYKSAPFDFAPFDFAPFDFAPFDFAQGTSLGLGSELLLKPNSR